VYAIYYTGDFPPYAPISIPDCRIPIYVGQANPPATRTGKFTFEETDRPVLFTRLRDHARSIRQVESFAAATDTPARLRTEHFQCRYLVLDPIWIALAEYVLISRFRPLWNTKAIGGFGNHPQGGPREAGARSAWDALHCRDWAARQQPHPAAESDLLRLVEAHFAGQELEVVGAASVTE
jgi:hypothetical protein